MHNRDACPKTSSESIAMSRLFLLSALTLTLALPLAHAADWSRFRGPNGSGIAAGPLPKIDPKAPLWKKPIPGRGVSSPIVVGGKVYVQTASIDGKTRTLLCLDAANGDVLWTKDETGNTAHTHAKNSLASSTPACDGETVLCVWWDGSGVALQAYDTNGKDKWRTSLGGYVSQHGPGMSPVIHNGLAYVNVDDDEHAELVAIDIKTGEKKWIKERKHQRASYSSPFILKRGNNPEELILGTTRELTSYDPATGKVNWNYDVEWPAGRSPLRVICQPVYVGGLIVMTSGDGDGSRYMFAVDPERKKPVKVWEKQAKDVLAYVPCFLVKDDLIFWIGDKSGSWASCADAKTGEVHFAERITPKEPSSSPIMVGDEILTISDSGDIVVFKAAKEYQEVLKTRLGEAVAASPAMVDGKLYIRGAKNLYCFGKK